MVKTATKKANNTAASAKRPFKHTEVVEVHLWNTHIGSVALDPAYGFYVFNYTPEFISARIEPSPLQMPLS